MQSDFSPPAVYPPPAPAASAGKACVLWLPHRSPQKPKQRRGPYHDDRNVHATQNSILVVTVAGHGEHVPARLVVDHYKPNRPVLLSNDGLGLVQREDGRTVRICRG